MSFLLVYIIGLEYFLTENFSLLISNIQIYYRVIALKKIEEYCSEQYIILNELASAI